MQNTSGYPVICSHISKLNVLAASFRIKGRDEGYTGHASACGSFMLLTTAFTT